MSLRRAYRRTGRIQEMLRGLRAVRAPEMPPPSPAGWDREAMADALATHVAFLNHLNGLGFGRDYRREYAAFYLITHKEKK